MTAVDDLREAARLMRERAEAATPGPWDRPLTVRYKNVVTAWKPADEPRREWLDGRPERCAVVTTPTWDTGKFMRQRGGRDLEHIAAWHPGVALAVADWLDGEASFRVAAHDFGLTGGAVTLGPDPALAVARAFLGRQP